MTMDPSYHSRIFERYSSLEDRIINFDASHTSEDGVTLRCTEQRARSRIGLFIDTGMTVPRESYYPVFAYFPDVNILAFDKRGHGESGGKVENTACFKDNLSLARAWKEERGLDVMIGLGHSYGGMMMAGSAITEQPPYDAIIAAAPPVTLKKAGGAMPGRFTKTIVYLYNLCRLKQRFSWDEIVRRHQSTNPLRFQYDPRIVAMKIDGAEAFNSAMDKMVRLTDLLPELKTDSYFFYGGSDQRLKIEGRFSGEYLVMERRCKELGIPMRILPGLSHRFNRNPEREFAFSYNNSVILSEVRKVVDRYRR